MTWPIQGAPSAQLQAGANTESFAGPRNSSQASVEPRNGDCKKAIPTADDPLQLRFITSTRDPQKPEAGVRRLVRSHVARKHHADRKQAWKELDASQAEQVLPLAQCECASTAKLQRHYIGLPSGQLITCPSCQATSVPEPVASRSISYITGPGASSRGLMVRQASPSPMTLLGASRTDPFGSFSIQTTPRMNILFDHFLNTVGPGMNVFLNRENRNTNPIKTIYVPFSIADPCVFQGLLLLSARSYAKLSGDDSFHVTAMACKSECFRLVNIAMQDPRRAISDATIATVLMLAVEELMIGDLNAFVAHLRGLKMMISLRGGLHFLGLNGILEQLALSCDHACMMFTGSQSFFLKLDAFPRILPATAIPPGFQNVLASPSTTPQLEAILLKASSGTLIKAFAGFGGTTIPELSFMDEQCTIIEQHLTRANYRSIQVDPGTAVAAVEKCVCLGVLAYYYQMLRSIPPPASICSNLAQRIYSALMPYQKATGWHDRNLLLWIIFAGAQTVLDGPMRNWYLRFFRDLSRAIGKTSWEETRGVLDSFLWNDRCDLYGQLLWSEAENIGLH